MNVECDNTSMEVMWHQCNQSLVQVYEKFQGWPL